MDETGDSVRMNDGIVPGGHDQCAFIPCRRDISVRPLKNYKDLLPVLEMLPLGVGSCHVRQERAVWSGLFFQENGQVARKRRLSIVRDESRKAVALDETCDCFWMINAKMGRNVHGRNFSEPTGKIKVIAFPKKRGGKER
jgi:hypothetical protein